MGRRVDFAKHADLMDRMATKVGLDLHEDVLVGRLGSDDVIDAVLACTTCSNPGACARWLDAMQVPQDKPPEYCQNIERFDEIKRGA